MRNYCFAVCEVGESKNIPVVEYMERSTNVLYCYLFMYYFIYIHLFMYCICYLLYGINL